MFPMGMRVLVVDDNPACLKILERLLLKCNFNVTVANQGMMALKMLRENTEKFDIVISDVHMPGMDGFKLLEHIGLELDLPVIMLSANDDPKLMMKGVRHGAVDYLLKPVRIEDLKNIWQHVVRKNRFSQQKGNAASDSEAREDGSVALLADGNGDLNRKEVVARKRKDYDSTTDDGGDEEYEYRNENADGATQKKPRLLWSSELHKKFVDAVEELGPDKAFPKKILDLMNVKELTRENVASHLQKYRLFLKKPSSSSSQASDALYNPFRLQDSSNYLSGRSLLNSYGMFCSLDSKFLLPNQEVGVPRSMDMNHFQHQNNIKAMLGQSSSAPLQTSCVATPSGAVVPTLLDYTRGMEKWKSGTSSRSMPQNDPLNAFNARNFSYNTVELQRWQDHKNGPSSISSAYNNPLVSVIDSSCQSFGQNYSLQYNSLADLSFGTSSLVQSAEVHESEAGALMRLDDNYLLEDTELLAGFTQDNCGTLDDIVSGLPK